METFAGAGTAARGGGGINSFGTASISGSTISGNRATDTSVGFGGGIEVQGTLNLTNSTLSGNFAGGNSGGINDSSSGLNIVTITNSTIANNRAFSNFRGIFTDDANATALKIRNSIVANNTGGTQPDISGQIESQDYNLFKNATGATITGTTTGNIIGVDPLLGPLSINGGATRIHALLTGSPAIDTGDPTVFPATDQRSITRPQDSDGNGNSRSDIGAYERRLNDILANNPFDFDGDGRTDLAIFRPASGEWWYLKSSNGGNAAVTFGQSTDKIVPGNYTGDGKSDFAFYRPSTGSWFILRSEDFSFYSFPFGTTTDIPAPGDYDGDGRTDAAVFRPSNSTWFVNRSSSTVLIQQFGTAGDLPVPNAFVP